MVEQAGPEGQEDGGGRATRRVGGAVAAGLFAFGVAISIFHIVGLGFYPLDPLILRSVHLLIPLVLVFALLKGRANSPDRRLSSLDWAAIALGALGVYYVILHAEDIQFSAASAPDIWMVATGITLVVLVLEATRRLVGLPLVLIALVALIYAYYGPYFPGMLKHGEKSLSRIFGYLLSDSGLLGVPLHASAAYAFLFVLFGGFLRATGVSSVFMDVAFAIAGRTRGGPAKVAIFSSALFGTISGSGIANVVTTGTLTIPLMKKTGYKPHFAGAVESIASSGGMITPPIMGSAAFIMAELLNIPYYDVVLAAAIPALIYYAALFWMVDFEAAKEGLRGLSKEELPSIRKVLMTGGYLLLPLGVLIYSLVVEFSSPIRASLLSLSAAVGIVWVKSAADYVRRGGFSAFSPLSMLKAGAGYFVDRRSAMGVPGMMRALEEGPKGMMEVAVSCATAGIIVGIISLTGIGLKFAALLMDLSGGHLFPALVLTMIICIILGMGLPATAAYIVTAAVAAPALINMGVPPLAAHMFAFHFSIVSGTTPPVALAAYAAAGIAKANPISVAFTGMRIGIAAFIVPYMFVYAPSLLMVGTPWQIFMAAATACVGTAFLAAGVQGYLVVKTNTADRLLFLAASFLLIFPGFYTDMAGFGMAAAALAMQFMRRSRLRILRDAEPSTVPLQYR
ncbi:MAG: TRAP transporter permease [Candidatus Tectomicrobia bacterium]|uniref:TRAP transporter permease n=1 Tax=Tectimicrobiota bacterium TaxID=2528274 RepID=A0A932MLV6_UNCTE|nr:TRAP transporter permease [Candidatus Tectomicrobia bacterium]